MKQQKLYVVVSAFALILASAGSALAAPPADSPIRRGQHPRLFFTQSDVPALRSRIATLYRSEFQQMLDILSNPAGKLNKAQRIEHWAAVNYAFVAALGPAELQALGFRLPAGYETPGALCNAAMANAALLLPRIASGMSSGHDTFSSGFPDPLHIPAALAYDWCYSNLGPAERAQIVDAFVTLFDREFAGRRYASMAFGSSSFLANNQISIWIHRLLGVAAFYGDSYPSVTKQDEMYEAFEGIWLERLMFELTQLYGQATGWHEGPLYFPEGYMNLGIALKMVGPALGADYFATMPFFTQGPKFLQAIIAPHSMQTGCGTSGGRCDLYLQRFGDGGNFNLPCKAVAFMAGALRTSAPREANLAKHLYREASPRCNAPFASNLWANGVLFSFLMGDNDVPSDLPGGQWAPIEKLGLGHYSFLNNSTSQVAFFGQPYDMYGHGSQTEGHFTIHKYGELLLKPGNSKGGDARLTGTGGNLFHNSVGIHKQTPDRSLQQNGGVGDPVFLTRGLRMQRTAEVKAEALARSFEYVFLDTTRAWGSGLAPVSQREFVYLTGPDNSEYVVTFDRVRVADPSTKTKIWHAWVPTEPKFVGGTVQKPRTTKWLSTGTNTVEVTNEQPALRTGVFESAPTHGRLFLRALAPQDAVLSALGGPDGEYQSGDDDGTVIGGTDEVMTPSMQAYLGWGRIEIRPGAARAYDTFLTVMQFGDSRTLTQMNPTIKLRGSDDVTTGVHVRDARNEWVVMFAEDNAKAFNVDAVTYTFQPAAGKSSHLLVDMKPGQTYYVGRETVATGTSVSVDQSQRPGAAAVVASSEGVVFFELRGLEIAVVNPPAPPRNLRIVQ